MENWFVVLMGLVTVFVVLVLIIGLCWLLGLLCRSSAKKQDAAPAPAAVTTDSIPDRAALAAAIAAAVAEYSGTDASAIRILSIKKI